MSRAAVVADLYAALSARLGPMRPAARAPLAAAAAAILGQNAGRENADRAMGNLEKAGALSSVQALRDVPPLRLAELIRPAGNVRLKAARLRRFLEFLERENVADVAELRERTPYDLREDLLAVSGIGRSTADAILNEALSMPVFIADAAAARLFARHGLIDLEAADPEEIADLAETGLPREAAALAEFHALIDRAARLWCTRAAPRCAECPARPLLPDPERPPQ